MNGYYEKLLKTKDELDSILRNYQTNSPLNGLMQNIYEVKKLNDNEEAENILISKDTIFIGKDKMQIKKLDGTIEKYNLDKYYPVDEKDEMIKMLNKKVEELERRLGDEHSEYNEPITGVDKSSSNDDVSS